MGLILFPGDGDTSSPDASWTYSGIRAFRQRLALAERFTLEEMQGFGGGRSWSGIDTPLKPLLDHPDAGGDPLSPAECAAILPRLQAITTHWRSQDGDSVLTRHIDDARRPTVVLQLCKDKDVELHFL